MTNIAIVCGSYHKEEIETMLNFARDQSSKESLEITEVVWVPGAMEVPLALSRLIQRDDIHGAACLGFIEKGSTQHGLAMGQAVLRSIIDLQLKTNKPIGLGIIGPGAEPEHIAPRMEPHARACLLYTSPSPRD